MILSQFIDVLTTYELLGVQILGIASDGGGANTKFFNTLFGRHLKLEVGTDALVCKSSILRQHCGKIKHLTTKQLGILGGVEANMIKIVKTSRAIACRAYTL